MKNKIPTPKETVTISLCEYPSYFVGYICSLDIETMPYTDECYHDAPLSISIPMKLDDLEHLKAQVEEAISKVSAIYEKYKDRKPIKCRP